jgi:signal transduction histidine kinase
MYTRVGSGAQGRADRRTRRVARRRPTANRAVAADRFFRHIVSSMRNGIIAMRRNGTLEMVNDEAYRIFALDRRPSDIGQPFDDVFRQRPELCRVLATAFEMTLPNRAELRLKDLERVVGYTLSQVHDDAGESAGAVLFFKDLTQVEQIEERERLRDRLAALGEMAAGIAHELKNPLAGIEVMAGLLRRQVPNSVDAQSILKDIISEAKLANAIVCDMLEFVRPVRLQVERIDMADIIRQAIALAGTKIPRGDVDIRLSLQPELPLIEVDEHQLCQVFTNLLVNAFEALGGRGHIDIRATAETVEKDPPFAGTPRVPTPVVVVEVSDDGPGVSAELTDRIFVPFFTTKPKGSGLGLPIVRKIVDAHEGHIDLTSTPGGGARFRMTLPVSGGSSWFK